MKDPDFRGPYHRPYTRLAELPRESAPTPEDELAAMAALRAERERVRREAIARNFVFVGLFALAAFFLAPLCGCDRYDWAATAAKLASCAAQSLTARSAGGEEPAPELRAWPDGGAP